MSDDDLLDAWEALQRIDWEKFEENHRKLTELIEGMSCWWCQKPVGKGPLLYLDGYAEVHSHCAKEASEQCGMVIKMEPDEMTDAEFDEAIAMLRKRQY